MAVGCRPATLLTRNQAPIGLQLMLVECSGEWSGAEWEEVERDQKSSVRAQLGIGRGDMSTLV